MRNKAKIWGFIAFAVIIGFSMTGCDDSGNDTPVTFSTLTANGSPTQTTTILTLTFSEPISGLTAADITLSGVSGVQKGILIESRSTYTLPISGFASGGTLSVAVSKAGYDISSLPGAAIVYYYNGSGDIPVTFSTITADGSPTQTTSQLTLTFSQAISGLTADDITFESFSGTGTIPTKGTLSGSGPTYTLPISGFTGGGTLSVTVTKAGYNVSGSPGAAIVYYYNGSGDIPVTFSTITADGSPTQTTSQLTLTFSQAISGLTADDITFESFSGSGNIPTKGTLSGSGPTYTLPISGFTDNGILTVSVEKAGYNVSGSPGTVSIYGPPAVPITGVTLDQATLTLIVGGTENLAATVNPTNATNKNISWTSSNTGVASVNNGTVTAVSPGSATITVTTADGGKTDTCVVTVNAAQGTAGITLNVEQIVDGAPLFGIIVISRTNTGFPVTYTVSVDASDFDTGSISWEVAGAGIFFGQTVIGYGSSFALNATDVIYNSLGGHTLILTVRKDGLQYRRAIPFTIMQ